MTKFHKALSAVAIATVTVMGYSTTAFAQEAGPLDGVGDDIVADGNGFLGAEGIPMLIVFLGIGVALGLLVKLVRKSRSAV